MERFVFDSLRSPLQQQTTAEPCIKHTGNTSKDVTFLLKAVPPTTGKKVSHSQTLIMCRPPQDYIWVYVSRIFWL